MTHPGCLRRFAEVARRSPDRIAVLGPGSAVSYARLAALAGGHAARLLDAGVRPGEFVGLVTGHGTAAIAAILGTLAAGCAYVPLDPTFPRDRLAHQVAAARVSAVLADPEHVELAEALCRNGSARVVRSGTDTAPLPVPDPEPGAPAYVLFTSGSTGAPKAIAQTHRNLLHVVDNQIATLGITAADRVSLLASFGFDAAIPDLYPALLTGAAVVPVDVRAHGVAHAARELARHEVTVYHSTPTVYRYLLDALDGALPSVRTVLLGGEQATYADVRRGRFAPDCVYVNGYGATEVTFAAQYRLTAADVGTEDTGPLPIGTALPGYTLTVLDGGELEVSGEYLVDGYFGQPGPAFGTTAGGVRSYRTGDLGRVRPDGNLVCLGRLDRQVKVRGFRIELTEIEARLGERPGVAEARVIVRDGELLAYVVPAAGSRPDGTALRAALAEVLPGHAVPAAVTAVAAFPLTVSGKLDEEALPDPRPPTPVPAGPMTPAERRVHAIWCAVLGHDRIGTTDAFFDVGGHSLLLGRVQQRLAAEFGAEVPLLDLLAHPTVAAQAAHLEQSTADDRPAAAGQSTEDGSDLIAVVGLACRFPGAPDADAFWWNLCAGTDSIHDHTDDELAALGIGPGLRADPAHVRAGGRLDGVEDFDTGFFGFTAEEATRTDPQHRLFLETAWRALEDAGRDPAREAGPVGVFTSAGVNRYFLFHLFGNPAVTGEVDPDDWEGRLLGRQLTDHLPGQVAYRFGLTGPAVAVQSACSSSLAAVGLAAQSLAEYRCDLAIAGGVSVTWPRYRAGGLASPDGRCRSFDVAADGAGFGSGAGVVVLRRLSDALADRDHIHAVLSGWAMTNDGGDRAGYAVPSPAGQAAAVAEALAVAEVDPAEVGLIEAHGSGTPLGDAIEVAALNRVFRDVPPGTCALGSVKTNIGHLDAAAGVAGLIKAVLAVRHGVLPPNLHFTAPHPEVDLAGGPWYVPVKAADWPEVPRRVAGVSAFGMGGTNVHVIVEEAPAPGPRVTADGPYVLPVSAQDGNALRESLSALRDRLAADPPDLADVAYTLAVGRRECAVRAAVVASTAAEAVEALDTVLAQGSGVAGAPGAARELAARWVGGAVVDWAARHDGARPGRVPLPGYPFQRTRCWIDPPVPGHHP
ncbi:beta-ketoacyl synthase N-terminal-like domain-containing protein [Amycolatopsis vancoresmycina]|uniref:Amino acid adenylation domain-containing protein n=1 Tax=Amycolatopsis vancoresmycina DSM 44592 TaxID=1292037 RepID=R1I498_9PSEU|nr:beta-ketoacyl synthase N-terminal-like domain-containing protein [Amycolatopsis vancoresmycina]EOD65304.1 amino acid adenylation domain-containing protein [Amycolatopsis vancoresmycina DSM 44592]